MGKVIDLSSRERVPNPAPTTPATVHHIEENLPHCSGELRCTSCRHEYIGVWPVGVLPLECPECGMMKSLPKKFAMPEGNVWTCNCSEHAMLFSLREDGILTCAMCGDQKAYEDV